MEKLTKKQLQAVCDQKQITYKPSTTKEQLIELINGNAPVAQATKSPFKGEY